MCLIINKPADVNFDDMFLQGVYEYNPDGVGVMYAEDNTLFHSKYVPSNFADFKMFWDAHAATRRCVFHARQQTHGPVQQSNSHPFQVISAEEGYPLYLVHNGILHTGNKKDVSKTDTWHFIQDYLRPMLLKNPEFFLTPEFSALIGDFIGTSNKFVLLDAYGNQVTINEDEFVEYNGAKLSNTYAWDTRGTEHDYTTAWRANYSGKKYGNGATVYNYPAIAALPDDDFVTTPWEAADEDMEKFCEAVFDDLKGFGMDEAYRTLSYKDLEKFYTLAGVDMAWEMQEMIQYNCWTDKEFVDEVRNFGREPESCEYEQAN